MGGDILIKMTTSDFDLLREYAGKKSEEAFATLVNRHLNLVYSAPCGRSDHCHWPKK